MIEAYLRRRDALLGTSALVHDVEIVRRLIRDTEFENWDLIEMTERAIEVQGSLEVSKYRHHWQDRNGLLIKRWDNAPHYRSIDTFPYHLHDGAEDHVVSHPSTTGLAVLQHILEAREALEQGQK